MMVTNFFWVTLYEEQFDFGIIHSKGILRTIIVTTFLFEITTNEYTFHTSRSRSQPNLLFPSGKKHRPKSRIKWRTLSENSETQLDQHQVEMGTITSDLVDRTSMVLLNCMN